VAKSIICKGIVISVAWVVLFFALGSASEEESIRFQGKVMDIRLEKRIMTVNEGMFFWDEKTLINDHKGSPIPPEMIKKKSWVYIEAETHKKTKNGIRIRSIHLLPKYIDNKEQSRYPFMQ